MKKLPQPNPIAAFFKDNAIVLAFIVASVATFGSLIFEYVLKYQPCELCWFQRIFMYSSAIMLGIAVFINDRHVSRYVTPLVVVGLLIAIYHFMLQLYPTVLPCTSENSLCAQKQFELFGFITIPFLSAAAFITILLLMIASRRK